MTPNDINVGFAVDVVGSGATMTNPDTDRRPPPGTLLIDRSLALLRDGNLFLPRLRWRYQSDVIRMRLMGKPAVAVFGPEGTELLYGRPEIMRQDAVPGLIRKSLMGDGGVQVLDGTAHRDRKQMFMDVVTADRVDVLVSEVAQELQARLEEWSARPTVHVMESAGEVLMVAAARWAGVPLRTEETAKRARDMARMVDGFGTVGPRHWAARLARKRSEAWMDSHVQHARADVAPGEHGTVLARIARHRDHNGQLLPLRVASVEVLNVIRPLVAAARWVAYLVLATHEHGYRPDGPAERRRFVEEVRRFYPFTPLLGGLVEDEFEWNGYRFRKGTMVVLDVYGLLRDPRYWDRPQLFDPDRFSGEINPHVFIPQGGGDYFVDHRCAGDETTVRVLEEFARFLTDDVTYSVPPQDMTVDPGRIPAQPASGMVISDLRPKG